MKIRTSIHYNPQRGELFKKTIFDFSSHVYRSTCSKLIKDQSAVDFEVLILLVRRTAGRRKLRIWRILRLI